MDLRHGCAPAFITGKDRASPNAYENDELRQFLYLGHGSLVRIDRKQRKHDGRTEKIQQDRPKAQADVSGDCYGKIIEM